MIREIGVIGLGRMGGAMARTLQDNGWTVLGWDRQPATRERAGVAVAENLPVLLESRSLLLLSLPDSAAVESVILDADGVLARSSEGALVIDCSTVDPTSTRRMQARLATRGIGFVDAPVSGGPAGAASATLTAMVGGEVNSVVRALPVLESLARSVHQVGGPGAGNVAKLVNNYLVAGQLLLVAEAMALGEAAGVAPGVLTDTVNGCSGRSAVTEVNLPRWILGASFDSGFGAGLMRKDVGLAQALASQQGLALELLARVDELWAAGSEALGAEADFNRIYPWLQGRVR